MKKHLDPGQRGPYVLHMHQTRPLLVTFSPDELRQRADRLASLIESKSALEDERKTTMASFRERTDEIDQQLSQVASEYRMKGAICDVPCREHRDYRECTVTIIRCDTGEVVETRDMTDAERQVELPNVVAGQGTTIRTAEVISVVDVSSANDSAPKPGEVWRTDLRQFTVRETTSDAVVVEYLNGSRESFSWDDWNELEARPANNVQVLTPVATKAPRGRKAKVGQQ